MTPPLSALSLAQDSHDIVQKERCQPSDVAPSTRTLDKHWQRQYREIRDRRGKGGRGVMRAVLHAKAIRSVSSVHRDVSTVPICCNISQVMCLCNTIHSQDQHLPVAFQRLMSPFRILSARDNNLHCYHAQQEPSPRSCSACVRSPQESRNSLPSTSFMERAESSGAAMAGLPARLRVPSPSLPTNQHRLVRLCRLLPFPIDEQVRCHAAQCLVSLRSWGSLSCCGCVML